MKLLRRVTITEKFSSEGKRAFQGISQSFESDSGQILSCEDAETRVVQLLDESKTGESQSEFLLPCLESVRQLIYGILAFPEPSDSDRKKLLALVFGRADFDLLSIETQEPCRQTTQNTLDYQLQRVPRSGLLPNKQ
jgi:hypothetical protein